MTWAARGPVARWTGRFGVVRLVLVALLTAGSVCAVSAQAYAHGAAVSPGSRTYLCYTDGHWTGGDLDPRNAACKAAVALGGKQPLWDWFGVLRSDGAGRTRGFIPDGKLCSAGSPKYAAYDLARADWPVTHLASGAAWTVRYNAWAPHPGVFSLFVTKDGYDPSRPLTWAALEPAAFSTWAETAPNGRGEYQWKTTLPARKSGRHIIYSVWSRTDSKETFYNCSDVVFDGGSGAVTGYPGASGVAPAAPVRSSRPRAEPKPGSTPRTSVARPRSATAGSASPLTGPPPTAGTPQAEPAPQAGAADSVAGSGNGSDRACRALVSSRSLHGGRLVQVSVINQAGPIGPWTVTVDHVSPRDFVAGWNGAVLQGTTLSAPSPAWNPRLDPEELVVLSYLVAGDQPLPRSADVRLNGLPCNGSGQPGGSPSALPPAGDATAGHAAVPAAATVAVRPAVGPTIQSTVPSAVGATTTAPPPASSAVGSPNGVQAAGCSAVVCDDFESQADTEPSGNWAARYPDCTGSGRVRVDTAVRHSGQRSLRVDGAAGYCNHAFVRLTRPLTSLGPTVFVRVWVRHANALPAGHVTLMAFADASDGGKDLRLGGQNRMLQWNRSSDDATLPEQSPAGIAKSAALPTGGWHCLEVGVTGPTGTARTWLDGTLVPGLTADPVKTPDIDRQWDSKVWRPVLSDLKLGWESYADGSDTLWFDDVAVSTARIGC